MMQSSFEPTFFSFFRTGYPRKFLTQDLVAGLIVGILSLPMSIAFAIASGARPEQGLYTAMVAGFIVALLGGSPVQISGPTGAFVALIYTVIHQHGYDGLVVATMLAGVLLIGMGLFRLGSVIRFIPHAVTAGFTAGLALLLFSSQIKDLLGMPLGALPVAIHEKWSIYLTHCHMIHWPAALVSMLTLSLIIVWNRFYKKIPGSLVAIFGMTALVTLCALPIETIGQRYGDIPNSLPLPTLPHFSWDMISNVGGSAISIALLAGIESLLCALVADSMLKGHSHKSDIELIAQGASNMASALFLGLPATGAIARTATNIKNGGRTPLAAIVNCVTILLIMLCFGKYVVYIPMCVLAAIMTLVCYMMVEWKAIIKISKGTWKECLLFTSTFLTTIFVGLSEAIGVGVLLASLFFMVEMEKCSKVKRLPSQDPSTTEIELRGSFFFGSIHKLKEILTQVDTPNLIIHCESLGFIDESVAHFLADQSKTRSIHLIGMKDKLRSRIESLTQIVG